MFSFTLMGQRVKAGEGFVDKSRMAHHQASVGKPVDETSQPIAEIGGVGKIVGPGEAWIKGDAVIAGATAESRAQKVEQQRFWCIQPLRQRQIAAALAHPGFGGGGPDRAKKRVAQLRKQLHVLVAVDVIRGAAEPG